MGNKKLQDEYSESHRKARAWSYGQQSHGPRYEEAYVDWLERQVVRLRDRIPDRHPCDVSGYYPEV